MELQTLKKWQLKALQTQLNKELQRRYAKKRPVKYGSLNKGFTEQEFRKFFADIRNAKAKTIFSLMAFLGLRIGEACRLRTADVDLEGRRLWVRSAKGSKNTLLFLHDEIYDELLAYNSAHGFGVEYCFPAGFCLNAYPHVSPNWARREFRETIVRTGLDFVYSESEESYDHRNTRRLHRLTTHSLRHYFITRCMKKTSDLIITQRLARHRDVRNTQRYIYTSQEELDTALVSVFAKKY